MLGLQNFCDQLGNPVQQFRGMSTAGAQELEAAGEPPHAQLIQSHQVKFARAVWRLVYGPDGRLGVAKRG